MSTMDIQNEVTVTCTFLFLFYISIYGRNSNISKVVLISNRKRGSQIFSLT